MYRKSAYLLALGLVLAIAGGVHAQMVEGKVLIEYWYGGGVDSNLDNLKAHPDFPDNPHEVTLLDALDQPDRPLDYWGARLRCILTAPADGDYTFWTASDDDSELWLSTDTDPANATMICSVEGWTSYQDWAGASGAPGDNQQSDPIPLVAGQQYYVEYMFSDGTGGGFGSVAWAGPTIGDEPTVITGDYLAVERALIPDSVYQAKNPDPADGAVDITTPLFKWEAGMDAVMHEVYMGTNPVPGPNELKGSMPTTMYFHLEPLEPGATYYWRVDEVQADGAKTEGEVWTFTVMPLEAHFPSPYNGALWRKTDIGFSWTAGQGAVSHVVYGGTDEAAVAAGDESALLGQTPETSFSLADIGIEALEPDTRYYWRIDEVDGGDNVVAGPVWTFTTIDPEGGAKAEYWANMGLAGDPDVVTVVPEVNFDWGSGSVPGENSPDPCIPVDGFSCCWTAQLNVPVTGTYTLYEASDDGARMKLNGALVAEGWYDRGTTEDATGPLELVAGETYVLEMEMYENGGGAAAFLRWEGPDIPKEIIPQGALQLPQVAHGMSPGQGAAGVSDATSLSWKAGMTAVEHDLYLGTDESAVAAGADSAYVGRMAETSYTPPELLPWTTTFYWKVDEVAEDGTVIPGIVYSFTVEDTRVIEDFEAYDDVVGVEPIEPVAPPIAHYVFEGDYNDISGNGHHGTPIGDISIIEDPIMGMVVSLPGGDDQFVEIGAVGLSGNDPTTIACWAKADNTSIPDWTLIFGFTGTDTGEGGNGSHFNVGSLGGPGGVGAHCWGWEETIFSDQEALEWHHYAMTYDGTTILYYGDGVLKDTDVGKSNVQDLSIRGDRVHIGSRVTQASSFPGQVDDARIYDYTLSDAEVASLFTPFDPVGDVWVDGGTAVSALVEGSKALQISYDKGPADVSAAVGNLDLSHGPSAMAVSVLGSSLNAADSMYMALEDGGGKVGVVPIIGSAAAVQADEWTDLLVSLDDFETKGVDLSDVVKVAVGIDASGPGAIVIDNVRTVNTGAYVPRNWAIDVDLPKTSIVLTGTDRQLTGHVIQTGEVFTLKLRVSVVWGVIWDGKNLTMKLYYDDDGKRVSVASKTISCAHGKKEVTLTFNSADVPEADGHLIGVELKNEIWNKLGVDKMSLTAK